MFYCGEDARSGVKVAVWEVTVPAPFVRTCVTFMRFISRQWKRRATNFLVLFADQRIQLERSVLHVL